MDFGDTEPIPQRKLKFTPKLRPARKAAAQADSVAKPKPTEADNAAVENKLLSLVKQSKEAYDRKGSRLERTLAPVQVAFGRGGQTSARTFGIPRYGTSSKNGSLQGPMHSDFFPFLFLLACLYTFPLIPFFTGSSSGSTALDTPKEYVEPWDYYKNYPVTLPLRRPFSGDPAILDEEEFGEASRNREYDETQINAAEELNLTENVEQPRMIFFQLPETLPLSKRKDVVAGKESEKQSNQSSRLEDLPQGLMGKMLVYKSGAVKMKIGDTLFDVSEFQ
ncbi:hypothetical protein QJS04_geneDACA013432 [Acorus gramineus]|uniref:DNA-directed RNA polymerase III subunit RPC4 n=1 Tax=Acorus gramineus TaxID=55184 RepID=A0AAV9AGI8_ACOGR|nr:hypothetical protein QJS04_geneDACA013432 [Acorus gramineus]